MRGTTTRSSRSVRSELQAVLVTVIVAVCVIVAIAGMVTLYRQRVIRPRLERYREGAAAVEAAHTALLDQHAALRAVVATGDPRFLEAHDRAAPVLLEANRTLSSELGDGGRIGQLVIDLLVAQQRWGSAWAAPALEFQGSRDPAAVDAFLGAGKTLFDQYRDRHDVLSATVRDRVDDIDSDEQRVLTLRLTAEALVGLAAIALLIIRHRGLLRSIAIPVEDLRETMARVEGGDLTARPSPSGARELMELGRGLDAMIDGLTDAHAQAVDRAREAEEHADRVKLILELSKEIAGSLNLRYVVQAVGRAAVVVSGFPTVRVWLLDPEVGGLTRAYDSEFPDGLPPEELTVAVTEGVVGRAARYGRPSAMSPDGTPMDADEEAADLAVPMVVGARVIGVLEFRSPEPRRVEEEMVENVAVHAATAVEAARLHRTTQELAQVDALTRLFNRRRLDDDLRLECERANRYRRPLALVMLDLDHFKQLNDTLGHQRGDEALQELGVILTDTIRSSDTAYRYGGEEFLLLLRETTLGGAAELAERLRSRVERRFAAMTLPVTASMGVTSTEEGTYDPVELLAQADRALYRAKQGGRNQVAIAGDAARSAAD